MHSSLQLQFRTLSIFESVVLSNHKGDACNMQRMMSEIERKRASFVFM